MASTTVGKSYRHAATGATGSALAQITDPQGALAQNGSFIPVSLTQLHLDDASLELGLAQDRFYPDHELDDANPA